MQKCRQGTQPKFGDRNFWLWDLTEGEVVKEDGIMKGGTRGSDYYEARFAHGLNIPDIFTCYKNSPGKVHFDIQQYSCIYWNTSEELQKRLARRIRANFGDGQSHPLSLITDEGHDTT
ncbi:MAG: hypothetical protein OXI24_17015 [Candidatus Poribacteria bacterium]|nr:hypothetical protein [Candidatus Poribacteria bacterium]